MGVEEIERQCRMSPTNVRFNDLYRLCVEHFGEPRNPGSSHYIFKTPWPGDPRVNIQNHGGKAKAYQVKQDLRAIDRVRESRDEVTDNAD